MALKHHRPRHQSNHVPQRLPCLIPLSTPKHDREEAELRLNKALAAPLRRQRHFPLTAQIKIFKASNIRMMRKLKPKEEKRGNKRCTNRGGGRRRAGVRVRRGGLWSVLLGRQG